MDSGSSGGRAAAAFAAIGLIIVTLGINISANSISAANDLMAFCPKYINIRRGQLLAAFIGSWVSLTSTKAAARKFTRLFVGLRTMEDPRIGANIPSFPRWLYDLLGSDDVHPHNRLLHRAKAQRQRSGHVLVRTCTLQHSWFVEDNETD